VSSWWCARPFPAAECGRGALGEHARHHVRVCVRVCVVPGGAAGHVGRRAECLMAHVDGDMAGRRATALLAQAAGGREGVAQRGEQEDEAN
jgi:hypothetical protein